MRSGAFVALLLYAAPAVVETLDQRAAPAGISYLIGHWRIAGVALMPGPMQAFAPNDPAYLGPILVVVPGPRTGG